MKISKKNNRDIKKNRFSMCKTYFLKLTILILAMNFLSCSNDDDNNPVPIATVSSISPKSGPMNTIVTITGSNFGTDASAVSVFFNDKEAVVQSVSDNEIKAEVPAKANTGFVKIVVDGTEITGPEFTYILTIEVNTLAGSTEGFTNGTGGDAQFSNWLAGIAVDTQGNVYTADTNNNSIRKITPNGVVTTFAGGTQGFADGTGTEAKFTLPQGVAVDASGNVYVADRGNHKIRKITSGGVVTTLAGSSEGFADGSDAQFSFPTGIAVDASGNVYVGDWGNDKIRKMTLSGVVSTLAGSTQGFADGTGTDAQFFFPTRIAVDASDNLFVADSRNQKIRKITPEGVVTTFAGSTQGFADGASTDAKFFQPEGVAIDALGNVYVADRGNHKIRKITPQGIVSTLAGSTQGFADGTGTSAQLDIPIAVTVDALMNVYITDRKNYKIRKITQE